MTPNGGNIIPSKKMFGGKGSVGGSNNTDNILKKFDREDMLIEASKYPINQRKGILKAIRKGIYRGKWEDIFAV